MIPDERLMKMTDERIVELYLARNEQAIIETKDKYGNRLKYVSYNIVQDEGSAEECENDTYLNTWNSVPPNEPRGYLFAYLARIIRNLSLNRIRNGKALKRQSDYVEITDELSSCIADSQDTEGSFDCIVLSKLISRFIRSLPELNQTLFVRRYWYLDSISQAAQSLGISEANAKIRLFRIREQLKSYLEKEGYGI